MNLELMDAEHFTEDYIQAFLYLEEDIISDFRHYLL